MKVSPESDYPIQVILESEEQEDQHFAGIFRVVLNHQVRVFFVPDVSRYAPPWDERWLVPESEPAATVEMARGYAVLFSRYAVTPNSERAGTEERFERPGDNDPGGRVVFYVTPEEFDRYAVDLDRLSDLVWQRFPKQTVSDLRGYEVVRFLERRVVDSGLLRPRDALMLGRGNGPAGA